MDIIFFSDLSPKYRLQILHNSVEKEEEEDPIDSLECESIDGDTDDKKVHPVSSVPLGSLDPATDSPHLDLMLKEQMCMQLKYRDEGRLKTQDKSTC